MSLLNDGKALGWWLYSEAKPHLEVIEEEMIKVLDRVEILEIEWEGVNKKCNYVNRWLQSQKDNYT